MGEFKVKSIKVILSNGDVKRVYPALIIDFLKSEHVLRSRVRREMEDSFMYKQGFFTLPKFVDINGNPILETMGVIDINTKYPGFRWVFYVEERFLEKVRVMSESYGRGVKFYENKF